MQHDLQYASKVIRHVRKCHLGDLHTIKLEYQSKIFTIFPCKLPHKEGNAEERSHYHCIVCDSYIRKYLYKNHLESHSTTKQNVSENPCTEDQDNVIPNRNNCHNIENENTVDLKGISNANTDSQIDTNEEFIIEDNTETVQCEECEGYFHPRSLLRHKKNKHKLLTPSITAVCVDQSRGLFMVRKYKCGIGFPCHVQKLLHDYMEEMKSDVKCLHVKWYCGP